MVFVFSAELESHLSAEHRSRYFFNHIADVP
jgi:hypothetical protein